MTPRCPADEKSMENMTYCKVLLTVLPCRHRARRGFVHRLPGVLLLATATGCATYREVAVQELPSQQQVRLQLTTDELVKHLSFTEGNQGHVSGRFVAVQGDSAIFVLTTPMAHQEVGIPLNSIVVAERKDPDYVRSILLSSAVVGTVATLAYLGFEGNQNPDPDGPGPVVDSFRPTFRLVFPIGR